MTEQEQRAAFEQAAREHAAQAHAQQMEHNRIIAQAAAQAQESQRIINETPRQRYACIVAVDLCGGFGKDGKIPWHYPKDFKWFQDKTKGHICVMGRATYDDINQMIGEKGKDSVLPNRKVFVVTSKPLPRDNAIVVSSIGEVDKHLTFEDADNRTVFFCGGERIYSEGIAKCDTLYITVVNKEVDADRFFPTQYTLKHFNQDKVFEVDGEPDLKFTVWKRK